MENLKVLDLTINNFKGVVTATIKGDGKDVIVLTGQNGSGKSSALDAIFSALQWAAASKTIANPVRAGANDAAVTVNLGKYVVTRKWKKLDGQEATTGLEVRNSEGAKLSPPQKILDDLIGNLSFDPMAFSRLKPADQRDQLLAAFGKAKEAADLDSLRRGHYEDRTAVTRQANEKKAQLAGMTPPAPDQSRVETPIANLMTELSNAKNQNGIRDTSKRALQDAELELDIAREKLQQAKTALSEAEADMIAAQKDFEEAPALIDEQEIDSRFANLESENRKAREAVRYDETQAAAADLAEKVTHITNNIDNIDLQKSELLRGLPLSVPDVAIGDAGITIKGVALSDCCTAEKWLLSIAIAMAVNPNLRIIRVNDGSLLDDAAMLELRKLAVEKDFQIWVERVADAGADKVVFVNGEVANDSQ